MDIYKRAYDLGVKTAVEEQLNVNRPKVEPEFIPKPKGRGLDATDMSDPKVRAFWAKYDDPKYYLKGNEK